VKARQLFAVLLLAAPLMANAQAGRLKMPEFYGLADKAKESVNIDLDGSMLQTASSFMSGPASGAPPEIAAALDGILGIYVRVFEFEEANAYSAHDLDGVRSQLQQPGWKKLMSVNSQGQRVDIYMREEGKDPKDGGLALIVSEPTEFVIVNVVGKVDPEKLRQLQGKFGVPSMPGFLGTAPEKPPGPR
jgi:uncharacterized protein DUF4252